MVRQVAMRLSECTAVVQPAPRAAGIAGAGAAGQRGKAGSWVLGCQNKSRQTANGWLFSRVSEPITLCVERKHAGQAH